MDLSKLPKLSQTPPPPPNESSSTPGQTEASPRIVYLERPASSFAEAWISIAIGVILLLVSPYTGQWLLSLVSSYKPPFLPITSTDPVTGQISEIPYPQSIFFFGQLCVFAFATVLILDGMILFTRNTALLMVAFAVTIIATGMNALYVIQLTMRGEGLPLISALATAFGIYIALHQWRLLQLRRA